MDCLHYPLFPLYNLCKIENTFWGLVKKVLSHFLNSKMFEHIIAKEKRI